MPSVPGTQIEVFHSAGADLASDVTSYLITVADLAVVIDPGPAWHVAHHLERLRAVVPDRAHVLLLVQSPVPGSLSGIELLGTLGRRRTVVTSWQTAAAAGSLPPGTGLRTVGVRGVSVPLGNDDRLVVRAPATGEPVGALVSFHTGARTLFSGPFFGSVGAGKLTGNPVLRRESVRAYADLFTPRVDSDLIALTFGPALPVSRIAPAHGKPVVGGHELMATVFADRPDRPDAAWAFHRLYVRVAALTGEETATAVFRAAGVPVPELDRGYHRGTTFEWADPASAWLGLFGRVEQWLPPDTAAAVGASIVRLAAASGLPVPPVLRRYAVRREPADRTRPAVPAEPAAGAPGPTVSAVAGPGSELPDFDDLTDRVTGLLNETVFRQRLASAFLPGEDGTLSGAVLFIRLDGIEQINAAHGRQGGNEALYALAYLLRNYQSAHARGGGHRLYKLTGSVFVYVIAAGDIGDAADHAEEVRRTVAESSIFLEQLTVSVGAVGVEEAVERMPSVDRSQSAERTGGEGEGPLDTLIHMGMGRLQVARHSGGNTVCSADPEEAAAVGTGATVLIADPDAPHIDLLTERLDEQGYSVLMASDGAEAIEIIEQLAPDVIICEVMLPKLSGFDVRERLRHSSRLSGIPFILVSHRKSEELVEKAALLGVVHYLRKPVSVLEIIGLVRNLSARGIGR